MKLLISAMGLASLLFASPSIDTLSVPKTFDMETGTSMQRDIKTKADFAEFISTLESAMKMGQINPYAYLLGLAYLNDTKVRDGMIKKDLQKARYYLRLSYRDGNYAAAYHLAMLLVGKKVYDQALFLIDNTIEKLEKDPRVDQYKSELAKSFLVTTFGTIVLEYKSKDKEAVSKAINIMESSARIDEAPTALFILANLYRASGNLERANELLNRSCKSTGRNKDMRLDRICAQFIVKKDGS